MVWSLAVTLIGTTALTPLANWRRAFREAVVWKIRHVQTGIKGPGAAGPFFPASGIPAKCRPERFFYVTGVPRIYNFCLVLITVFVQKNLDG
jgi:hypothetical protein